MISWHKIFVIIILLFFSFRLIGQAPDWRWARSAGGNSYEGGYSIAVDNNGNLFLTGNFKSSSITFGNFTLNNSGDYDIFLVKYGGSGNVIWAKSAGGTFDEKGESITTDKNGNVYITGYFQSPTITFGNYTLNCMDSSDIFIVKYSQYGDVVWAKSAGGSDSDYGNSISVDLNGNLYVSGFFRSPILNFGNYILTNTASGYYDVFLAKYSENGSISWAKNFGGNVSDRSYAIISDAIGNISMTGCFYSSSITFGNNTLNNSGSFDFYIVKFNSSGNTLWARSAGGADNDRGYGISVDALGNTYVTGSFWSPSISFGSYTLLNSDSSDTFVTNYDEYGNVLWARSEGGNDIDQPTGIVTNSIGSVCVTGFFKSPEIYFNNYILNNATPGFSDIFLFNYDADGNRLWAASAGGSLSDYSECLTINKQNQLYIAGRFYSPTIDFGNFILTKNGWDDVFVAKLDKLTDGIDEIVEDNLFYILSNPTMAQIIIIFKQDFFNNEFTASIYNINGQLILHKQNIHSETKIAIAELNAGIYILRVSNNLRSASKYFVVY